MRGRSAAWVIGALAAGVVLGFVLGGVGPRRELSARDARIAELETTLERAEPRRGWRSPVPGLDQILRAPPDDGDEGGRGGRDRSDRGATGGSGEPEDRTLGDAGAGSWRERWRARSSERDANDTLSSFHRVVAIQDVRRLQSRAALREQAGLDDEELAEVDRALATMNDELFGHSEELLVLALDDEPPPARDLLGITHDVTGILHRAQLALEAVVGPERAGSVDPTALEIWNHIDLGELEPAARAAAGQRAP